MGLLQNESFAAALFLRLWFNFFCFCGFLFKKKGGIFELEYSKADRECSRGLSVENFSVFIAVWVIHSSLILPQKDKSANSFRS